ncbi:hypothetical protein ONS95_009332 [Cadophora gregata]|uniref:uncharacterized protein n=1 Tax=Cadophora gregata TaxID=51156 RepID=UPI0026DBECCE|nr:uncharacterized protein ONS95_009332 [Cadophora gregata]KAK0124364.1 hypothetical protein ONS95_009332 [Cadophora gregata]
MEEVSDFQDAENGEANIHDHAETWRKVVETPGQPARHLGMTRSRAFELPRSRHELSGHNRTNRIGKQSKARPFCLCEKNNIQISRRVKPS